MRRHGLSSQFIIALLLTSLLLPSWSASQEVITQETIWSGDIILEADVIVSAGATLTIEPGATIDGSNGFTIEVSGALIAEFAHFFSSATPTAQSSHGQGLWQGIVINPTGSVVLTDTLIENTNAGVLSHGNLLADGLTVVDSYFGIKNYAYAEVNDLTTESIDYDAIMNSGNMVLTQAEIHNASTGISNDDTLVLSKVNFSNVGSGIAASSGSVDADQIYFVNTSVGLTSSQGVAFHASNVTGNQVNLLANMGDSDDFTMASVAVEGSRLAKSTAASQTELRNIVFTANDVRQNAVVEQDCLGVCILDNISIINASMGVSLSGAGHHSLAKSDISAENYAIRSISHGSLTIDNSSITAERAGIVIRDTHTQFTGQNNLMLTAQYSIGLDLLGGVHSIDGLNIAKQYDSTDTSSIGVQAWYTTAQVGSLTTENFSTGVTMRSTTFAANTIANLGGNSVGTEIIDSTANIATITTKYQENGLILSENSHLSTYQLTAQLHDKPLQISAGSTAYLLEFVTINTNPSYSDASGQGAVYYGYNPNLDIAVATRDYFQMTTVGFTDMTGNVVETVVVVNTFEMTTDENGEATLPLFSSGSLALATVQGVGVEQELFGGVSGQVVQVPVIPNGDWVISGNAAITLQSLDSTQPISGNLTIQDNAKLQLKNTILELYPGKSIVIENNAQITGLNSTIISASIILHDSSEISSHNQNANFTIDSSVVWNCHGEKRVKNLFFTQQVTIGSGCQLVNENGGATGDLIVPTTSSFTITAELQISVVDRGIPIPSAIIQFDGTQYYTNLSGEVTIESIARLVDSQGDIAGVNQNVILQLEDFYELITWNTSFPKSHQFIVSTLDAQEINAVDITLESTWSPYYLKTDLTIPVGRTMTVTDGVAVRISDGVEITILGSLEASSATFSSTGFGDRWSGLIMESQYSNVVLAGTTLLESSPAVIFEGGNFEASDVSISRSSSSRALIEINEQNGGTFRIANSVLSDASSACIDVVETTIQLELNNIELYRCNGPALRAENANLTATGIVIGQDSSNGLMLSNVAGLIQGIDATRFNGAGNIIKLDYINGDLSIKDVNGVVGGAAGISGANNRALDLRSVRLTGAPAIDFDSSAGIISNLTLQGQGFGTALISHHGRYSDSVHLRNVTITDYAVGLDLHADGADTTAPMEILNGTILSATALSIDNYPLIFNKGEISGAIDVSGLISVKFIDIPLNQEVSVYEGASIEFFQAIQLQSTYSGVVKPSNYTINLTYSNGDQVTMQADGKYVELQVKLQARHEQLIDDVSLVTLYINADSSGHPVETRSLSFIQVVDLSSPISFMLLENQAPQINSVTPNSTAVVMQTLPFESTIIATDDNDNSHELTYQWILIDGDGSEFYTHTARNHTHLLTINAPGDYLLTIRVTDNNQAQSEQIVPIEVLLLDSDSDYLSTCNDATWFDLTLSRSCGPDVYDSDDDNDGIIDSRDEWPVDPCAWQDSDRDGQPDELNCPVGKVTELFEDQDDDGDGIPDILEGSQGNNDGQFDSLTLILIVVSIIVAGMYVIRSRKGLGE